MKSNDTCLRVGPKHYIHEVCAAVLGAYSMQSLQSLLCWLARVAGWLAGCLAGWLVGWLAGP